MYIYTMSLQRYISVNYTQYMTQKQKLSRFRNQLSWRQHYALHFQILRSPTFPREKVQLDEM